jgi:hypothetical protein
MEKLEKLQRPNRIVAESLLESLDDRSIAAHIESLVTCVDLTQDFGRDMNGGYHPLIKTNRQNLATVSNSYDLIHMIRILTRRGTSINFDSRKLSKLFPSALHPTTIKTPWFRAHVSNPASWRSTGRKQACPGGTAL